MTEQTPIEKELKAELQAMNKNIKKLAQLLRGHEKRLYLIQVKLAEIHPANETSPDYTRLDSES